MASVIAVCSSEEKGIKKEVVAGGVVKENYGLIGDAHADFSTNRQVSLLAMESIDKMRHSGFNVNPGDFAENLTTKGIDLTSLPVGTRLSIGKGIVLEITQIGKKCHTGCAIFRLVGKCIMPKEGVFTRVMQGGFVKAGDRIRALEERGSRFL
jgi:MOSC domain-containing protein YiiM